MASMWTVEGLALMVESYFSGVSPPANFKLALCTAATAPLRSMTTLGQMVEIAAGAGYTAGGFAVARNGIDWPTFNRIVTGDESTGVRRAEAIMKDVVGLATGGDLPLTGDPARYAVLVVPASPVANSKIVAIMDLGTGRTVSDGQSLTLDDPKLYIDA